MLTVTMHLMRMRVHADHVHYHVTYKRIPIAIYTWRELRAKSSTRKMPKYFYAVRVGRQRGVYNSW